MTVSGNKKETTADLLLNSIPDEIWVIDKTKKITLINPSVVKAFKDFGTDDIETVAGNLEIYRSDGSPRPVGEAPLLRALGGEVIINEEEIIRSPATGELRYRQVNAVPVKDQEGNIISATAIVRDVTEIKKTEEALRYSNERLGLISSITSQLLSAANPQLLIQELCEKVMKFLDCDVFFNFLVDEQKEQLHLNAFSGVSAEVAKTFEWLSFGEAVCGCAAQEGKRIVCENIPDTQDVRTALVRSFGVKAYAANPIFSKGKVIGTLSFGSKKKSTFQLEELSLMQTVTAQISVAMERKIDEEKLKRYTEHLEEDVEERTKELELNAIYARSLIEASLDPLVTISPEGKITDVNAATELVTGCSREELVGTDFSNYFTDPKLAKAGYERVFTKGYVKDYPLTIRQKSGKLTDVLYNAAVYRNKSGDVEGVFAAARDITERVKAEAALRSERKRLYDVLESVPVMVALLTPDYHVAFANRSFKEKFGESKGRHCYEYCFEETQPCSFCESYKVLKTGRRHHWQANGIDGSVIDVHDFPFVDADGASMILEMDIDITEQKKLEKQLKDSERLAAIGATAGMVGHDIRNPLQAITSDVYLAKGELAALPISQERTNALESMDEIENNVDYINKIVQDLQDYARPLNPVAEESDLEQIVEKLIAKNGLPKNITISVKVAADARKISADSYYINRILYNLVTNSVQAMPKGGRLTIRAFKELGDYVITVKDTGVGIPKDIQSKMFTPMFTTKSKGQGFGLPVVKRMTESLGGTVIFRSHENKGTTFTIRLSQKS